MRAALIVALLGFAVGLNPALAAAATAYVTRAEHIVVYEAAAGEANQVEVARARYVWTISDAGAMIVAGRGCTRVDDHRVTCESSRHALVYLGDLGDTAIARHGDVGIVGGDGDDQLAGCPRCNAGLIGGSGDDVLTAASTMDGGRGDDTITGSHRSNWLQGGPGSDVLRGGGGSDQVFPGAGNDAVAGGRGRDAVFFQDAGGPVTVNLKTGRATGQGHDALASIADIIGTNGADRLIGDGGGNALSGVGGSDVLVGGAGNDRLVGGVGRGKDRLFAGSGNDFLWSDDRDRDVVRGQQGYDRARVDRRDDVRGVEKVIVKTPGVPLVG